VHFCENNGFAIFAEVEEMHPTEHLSTIAEGLNIPTTIVEDGQDVFAIAEAVIPAIERARTGGGPTFVEAKCLRFKEHDIGNRDLRGWKPREKEEYEAMLKRDPVLVATERARAESLLTDVEIEKIHEDAELEVARAVKFADDSPVESPTEEELMATLYAPRDGVFV
jgi:pyruvate dehydrogenase E1 component alpha subunit